MPSGLDKSQRPHWMQQMDESHQRTRFDESWHLDKTHRDILQRDGEVRMGVYVDRDMGEVDVIYRKRWSLVEQRDALAKALTAMLDRFDPYAQPDMDGNIDICNQARDALGMVDE